MITDDDQQLLETRAQLLGSLLTFTEIFYKIRTGRDFQLSNPVSRESHFITIAKALTMVFEGKCHRLRIHVPPRYGKSEMIINFIAWALALYDDCNFMYVSCSLALAKKQTQTVRNIISLPAYKKIFGVELSDVTSAKYDFETKSGGNVYAAGAGGTIIGRGAGIQNCNRFGGGIIIDDIHKADEADSDVVRENVIDWYYNSLLSRVNSPETPIIYIGQRLHEEDLGGHLDKSKDWHTIIIPALDDLNNALHPTLHDTTTLLKMKEDMPYVFASQYQQNPQPAGGSIFKEDKFYLTDDDPNILATFITADTAETDKDYNDATVFSFWGVYYTAVTNELALHWLDCREMRIGPEFLEHEFKIFYTECSHYKLPPRFAVIENKSTGVTLSAVLKQIQGFDIRNVERTRASGSKTQRYLEISPYINKQLISLPRRGRHTEMCINHCKKITANNTHAHDDIADTLYDAVKIALIDKYITLNIEAYKPKSDILRQVSEYNNRYNEARRSKSWQ